MFFFNFFFFFSSRRRHTRFSGVTGVQRVLFRSVAIIVAWAFEVTPEGVRRTEPEESEAARPAGHRRHVGRALNIGIIVVLAAAVGLLAWQRFGTGGGRGTPGITGAGTPATPAATVPAKSIAVLP